MCHVAREFIKKIQEISQGNLAQQCAIILILTKSNKLESSNFLLKLFEDTTTSLLSYTYDNISSYTSNANYIKSHESELYPQMGEYLLSIYQAQQHPNSTLSNHFQTLYIHAQNHLIHQPLFALCFHNLSKNLWDDKNSHQAIHEILNQNDEKIIAAFANNHKTNNLKELNLLNWLTDCLKFIANTHDDKDNEKIYSFYQKLFEKLIDTKSVKMSLYLEDLTYLNQINQFALKFINNNQPDSTMYKIATQLYLFVRPFFKNNLANEETTDLNNLDPKTLENCLIDIQNNIDNLKFTTEYSKDELTDLNLYREAPLVLKLKLESIFNSGLPSLSNYRSLINDAINSSLDSSSAKNTNKINVLHTKYEDVLKYIMQCYKLLIAGKPADFIDFLIHVLCPNFVNYYNTIKNAFGRAAAFRFEKTIVQLIRKSSRRLSKYLTANEKLIIGNILESKYTSSKYPVQPLMNALKLNEK